MQRSTLAPLRNVFAAVFPFRATNDFVAEMVPANSDRRSPSRRDHQQTRVTREEIQALFGAELRASLS